MSNVGHSGGCQCGTVRFSAARLGTASICHCRMCQKAFGSFFGPLVPVHDLTWTRGAPAHLASSNKVRRGFCPSCGTPLSYDYGGPVEIAIGAFDDPAVAAPAIQLNLADKLPFFDRLCALPVRRPEDAPDHVAFKADTVSRQHPDHDTAGWPERIR